MSHLARMQTLSTCTQEKREGTVDTKGVGRICYQRISKVSNQAYPGVHDACADSDKQRAVEMWFWYVIVFPRYLMDQSTVIALLMPLAEFYRV